MNKERGNNWNFLLDLSKVIFENIKDSKHKILLAFGIILAFILYLLIRYEPQLTNNMVFILIISIVVVIVFLFIYVVRRPRSEILQAGQQSEQPEILQSETSHESEISQSRILYERLKQSEINMLISFDFKQPKKHGANLVKYYYEIMDTYGTVLCKCDWLRLTRDQRSGMWMCFIPLPHNIKYEHTTKIVLLDDNGDTYEATRFILQHTLEI